MEDEQLIKERGKSLVLFRNDVDIIAEFDEDAQHRIICALYDWFINKDSSSSLSVGERVAYKLIKDKLERLAMQNYARIKNGAKGGRKPKNNLKITEDKPDNNLTETEQEPALNNTIQYNTEQSKLKETKFKEKQEKETPTSGDDILIDERFEKFWQAYPTYRRTDKKKCREKFMRIIKKSKDPDLYQKIMEGLNHWKQSEMWNSEGGKFVCAPLVWLNNERWNDEIQKQAQQSKIQQSKYIQNPENSRSASWVGEGAEDLLRELKEATNR